MLRIPKMQYTDDMKLKKDNQSMGASVLPRKGNKILTGGNKEKKSREQRLKERPNKIAPPGYPSHIQSPDPDTIADAKKCRSLI